MKTRLAIPIMVVLVFLGTLVLFRIQREPAYEDRTLGEWLLWCDGSGSSEDRRAREAIRALGTNAIPSLLELVSSRDSKLMRELKRLAGKQSVLDARFPDPSDIRYQALEGFAALGSMASPAIPELMRLGVEEENEEAALAILLVGSDAAPKLTGMLTHSDWRYRYSAAGILVKLDYASVKTALPAVIERLKDEAWQVRRHAGFALEEYFNPQPWMQQGRGERAHEPDQRVFLNALIPCLDDDHPEVRVMAVSLIGRLGPVAKSVVPSVAELLADGDPQVRRYAHEALLRIDPDRDEKGGSQ